MPELPRQSYGHLPREPVEPVYCAHGEYVGSYPEEIPALLTEDEIVRLQLLLLGTEAEIDAELASKLRAYQLAAFVRWHG